jgi:hypothetical protein
MSIILQQRLKHLAPDRKAESIALKLTRQNPSAMESPTNGEKVP